MAGKIMIFVASVVGIGTASGVALGQYATAARPSAVDATGVQDDERPSSYSEAAYEPVSADSGLDMAPDHVPVCRKGCGPRLGERQASAYYDGGSTQLDRIYGGDSESYRDDPLPIAPARQDADVAPPPAPRPTLGEPCMSDDCEDTEPVHVN